MDLRNDLHHIQGLLDEVLSSEIPALRGQLVSSPPAGSPGG
jgi:hypothetical protein